MSIEIFLLLFGVGVAAGMLSGLFGVGGGLVIVPSLIYYYSFRNNPHPELTVQAAIATSLLTIIFTSVSSSYKHFTNKNIDFKAGSIAGLSSAVTVFFVSKIAVTMHGDSLKYIIVSVLIIAAVRMLIGTSEEAESGNTKAKRSKTGWLYCVPAGVLTGTIAVFTGLGGAIFATPIFHYVLKLPFKKSIGTTTFTIFVTAIASVVSYYVNAPPDIHFSKFSIGIVDFQSALPIVLASIPFAQVGVYIHNRINTKLLTRLFAFFILAVSVKMIFF